MEEMIETINSFGWLANLSGILALGTPVLFILKKPRKWVWSKFKRTQIAMKYHSVSEFIHKNELDKKSYLEPKSLRVLILDDEPQNYPIDYLKESKYDVESMTRISLSKIDMVMKYHIIVLDITGIVEEDLQQGGFELLKRLRNLKPCGQAIIAASSKRFDMSVADFYKLADLKIKTPIEPIEIEEILRDAAKLKFDIVGLAQQVDSILSKISNIVIREKITSDIIFFLENKGSFESFAEIVSSSVQNEKEELLEIIKSLSHQLHHEKNN